MIAICTVVYNKLDFVKRTIESVLNNTKPPYLYVLVYNDSPYEGVWEYIEGLKTEVDFIIRNPSNVGISRALAQGLKKVMHAPHITHFCKIDDDTIALTRDWNEKMIDAFEVFPYLGVLSADIDSGKQTGRFEEHTKEGVTIQVFDKPSVGGALTIYPLEVFKKVGFFKDFGYYGMEDGEFAQRCRECGYQSAYLKGVNCQHLGRTSESDPFFDEWKIAAWCKNTNLDYPDWLRKEHHREVRG